MKIDSASAHWREFCSIPRQPQGPVGISPADYVRLAGQPAEGWDTKLFCRGRLEALCRDGASDPWTSFVSIMAWGGQNAGFGGSQRVSAMFSQRPAISELVLRTRDARTSSEAFSIWADANVRFLWIAFFTKVIHFEIGHRLNCFILDTWLARSFNLLTDRHISRAELSSRAKAGIAAHKYAAYCDFIQQVPDAIPAGAKAKPSIHTPSEAEEALFCSGKIPGPEGP